MQWPVLTSAMLLRNTYAMSGAHLNQASCCTVSSTDLAMFAMSGTNFAMLLPGPSLRLLSQLTCLDLSSNDIGDTLSPCRTSQISRVALLSLAMLRRVRDAMYGTDLGYAATYLLRDFWY
eukprot:2030093-Rhodomonas_salina.2